MDIQKYLNNAVIAAREDQLKTSPQLTIGELILKLEGIVDKTKIVEYDFEDMKPTEYMSWRGAYREIALGYGKDATPMTVEYLLNKTREVIGKTYVGYKGGDFVMGKNTPIWVDNYGNGDKLGLINVTEQEGKVILNVEECEY